MNKFIFCCSAEVGSYVFSASWDEDLIVSYEIEDDLLDRINWDLKKCKGTLNKEISKIFIDYINKASIGTIEENIEKNRNNPELQVYCTDCPSYQVMYMNGYWFNTAGWYSGDFASQLEQYKYLYLAMMLCDENVINFIRRGHEGDNIDIPFERKVRDLYFSDENNEIIYFPNNIKQAEDKDVLAYYEEIKVKIADCFRKGFKIPKNSSDSDYWDVVLINDNDEIFYYTGCKNDNPCLDRVAESINDDKLDVLTNPKQVDIVKKP